MKVQVIKTTTNELPSYGSVEAAGCDLRADLWSIKEKFLFDTEIVRNEDSTVKGLLIQPGGRALIPTGLHIALPVGYEAQIRPRSGLALKNGITVLNTNILEMMPNSFDKTFGKITLAVTLMIGLLCYFKKDLKIKVIASRPYGFIKPTNITNINEIKIGFSL